MDDLVLYPDDAGTDDVDASTRRLLRAARAQTVTFTEPGRNPALVQPWPLTLPVELAMRHSTPKALCEAYGISRAEWNEFITNPEFVAEVRSADEELRKEGMVFKTKARLQSEELLKTSWNMIHDRTGAVPAAVRADLIKFTVRAAGLDGSKDQGNAAGNGVAMQINISL